MCQQVAVTKREQLTVNMSTAHKLEATHRVGFTL